MPFTFSSLKNRKNKYLTRNLNNKTTTQKENTVNTTTAATTIRSFGFCNNVQADYLKAGVAEWEGAAAHLHSTITAISAKALAGAYRQMSDQMERYQQAPTESSCDQLMKKEQALQSQVDLATLALSHFIEKEGAFRPVSHLINTADAVHESCLGTETLESIAATKQRLTTLLQPSTLEEVADADLLVHLVDATDDDPDAQITAVRTVLTEIGADSVDELVVFNKIDAADANAVTRLRALRPDASFISAQSGEGIELLLDDVARGLNALTVEMQLVIPYARGDVLAEIHATGDVLKQDHTDSGTDLTVRLPNDEAHRFRAFVA